MKEQFGKEFSKEWARFIKKEQLSEKQTEQFLQYMIMLDKERRKINVTTITDPQDVVAYHFRDSLRLRDFFNVEELKTICDIGTGGGFPGIPLKILFPHLALVLIEVNNKKVRFLQDVIQKLELKDCEISTLDWRTFLRKTSYKIDLFCARALLHSEELIRMFKPSCPYKDADLVYWATKLWRPEKKVEPFFKREYYYTVGDKRRKLVAFGIKKST